MQTEPNRDRHGGFSRSFLGWSARGRIGLLAGLLGLLWLMVAWAVALR